MRLWTLHPKYLDARGLVALWREALLAQAVLAGRTRGYTRHPQLRRFLDAPVPADAIASYLREVLAEATRRGYRFDASKIDEGAPAVHIEVTRGQLDHEREHLRAKLATRSPAWLEALGGVVASDPHPLFRVVAGPVADWESVKAVDVIAIRAERSDDVEAVHALNEAAFPTDAEARLVDLLRDAGRLSVSLVATLGEDVIGHIAFSPVATASGVVGAGLAPLAVLESARCRGVGARLVRAGLDACRAAGYGWVVVLGDPGYYGKFGFSAASGSSLSDEYGGGDAFQLLELVPGNVPVGAGLVSYAPEFGVVT
jgi:putative acetyltransferase